jgi:hypothetical protein
LETQQVIRAIALKVHVNISNKMEKLTKIFMLISFVACLICLAGSIWLLTVERSGMTIGMTIVFSIAAVFFGINAWKQIRGK